MLAKHSDTVFLLTLIDFLLQIIFLGLFVYVMNNSTEQDNPDPLARAAYDGLAHRYGSSSVSELTDILTRLVPADQFRDLIEFLKKYGNDPEKVRAAVKRAEDAELKGLDKPPCYAEQKNGKTVVLALATVIASDQTVTLGPPSEKLKEVLRDLQYSFADVRSLSLEDFQRKFSPIVTHPKWGHCRFSVDLVEKTPYTKPRDAIEHYFYLKSKRSEL